MIGILAIGLICYLKVDSETLKKRERFDNKSKSIFLMFTWRELKKNNNISNYYLIY